MTTTSEIPSAARPASGFRFHHLPVSGALVDHVSALVAVEVEATGPLPLAIAPHESLALCVQFGRDARHPDAKAALGHNTCLTGIRQWTGSFVGAGNCLSLFALLTPLGAVRLLDSRPLQQAPRIRAKVCELLDESLTHGLESAMAAAHAPQAKLHALAAWLEARATMHRRHSRAALRAGRAATRLCAQPTAEIDRLAEEQCISRRQLERDFERWLGTSPKHVAQVARVQAVSREVHAGESLAHAAQHAGFADQAHMTRVVRQLTGLTPRGFVGSQRTPIAAAFRAATGGTTVYL